MPHKALTLQGVKRLIIFEIQLHSALEGRHNEATRKFLPHKK